MNLLNTSHRKEQALAAHQPLLNSVGWFLLLFFGVPGLVFILFAPDSRLTSLSVFGLTMVVAIPCIAFRSQVLWDSNGLQIHRGFWKLQHHRHVPCDKVETLVLYGHWAEGGNVFSLWASLKDGNSLILENRRLFDAVELESLAEEIGATMKLPVQKHASYYQFMKQASNSRKPR